jgi:hypothetical protein
VDPRFAKAAREIFENDPPAVCLAKVQHIAV